MKVNYHWYKGEFNTFILEILQNSSSHQWERCWFCLFLTFAKVYKTFIKIQLLWKNDNKLVKMSELLAHWGPICKTHQKWNTKLGENVLWSSRSFNYLLYFFDRHWIKQIHKIIKSQFPPISLFHFWQVFFILVNSAPTELCFILMLLPYFLDIK